MKQSLSKVALSLGIIGIFLGTVEFFITKYYLEPVNWESPIADLVTYLWLLELLVFGVAVICLAVANLSKDE